VGGLSIGTVGHPLVLGDCQVRADLVLEIPVIEAEAPPLQPRPD
jgi:hypothetical protein